VKADAATRVLVAGATGYTGALAAHLVDRHPRLELAAATSRTDAGKRLDSLYPQYGTEIELTELDLERADEVDAAIVALPHGASAPVVAGLRGLGVLVVDLSADFRIVDVPTYELWYGDHSAPELLEDAVYGLTELHRDRVREAELVANPGCYPTAALLALAPLADSGLVEDVVIDAKSGTSGAGRGGVDPAAVADNFSPYGAGGHRHSPEIDQELAVLGADVHPTFIPHLLPFEQGLEASCYVSTSREISRDELQGLFADRYRDEPFVEVVDDPPDLRSVRGTNRCQISLAIDNGGRAIVFAAIDNLWKGASGQALQNLNLMLGLDETEGLA
jgi:N-acetyl-gamma-glutamyl-phosphate reductase